ncbi:MAG: class I SAM-dependent methyltransferase [Treponema sp.]|nr:class I SAM-dependent methyltransferase [Treponema sp.]
MAELILDFYKNSEAFGLSEEESAVAAYIYKNSPNEDYNELIKNDKFYFIKYTFSDFRQSILRWYPFKKDSSVLEIGAEYGAITGALCDSCAEVFAQEDSAYKARCICDRYSSRQNLTVYAGKLEDIQFNKKFDYIICFRKLEETESPVEYLNFLKGLLSADGILLICVENQYGVQYLAGKKETYSGIPFDSIAGYGNRKSYRGYNRAALERIIKNSALGEGAWKFYYPFPDYIAPRAIFTDEGQPEANMRERLCILRDDVSSYIANDENIFMDAIDNKVFSFLSNYFFVELAQNQSGLSNIKYMTLSAGYRERKHSFAVMIRRDDVVQKKCLFSEAEAYAQYLCSIAEKLSLRGISVLPMKYKEGSIYMDFVKAQTVQLYIRQLVMEHAEKEKILDIFDRIWEDILKSSDKSNVCAVDTAGLDVGVILKNAFIEMVTINSFWMDGKIVYFDQEYVRENYPAKYVLFRSINMVFGDIPQIESIVKREEVLNRFEISDRLWKLFLTYENELSEKENPWHRYFYTQQLELKTVLKNRKKLLEESENGR